MAISFSALTARLLKPKGRNAFLYSLPPNPRILDVGCGNNSPALVKRTRPDCWYIGLDIDDYNQAGASRSLADEYVTVSSSRFVDAIAQYRNSVDAVISSHNLEHCDEPLRVLNAMLEALRP